MVPYRPEATPPMPDHLPIYEIFDASCRRILRCKLDKGGFLRLLRILDKEVVGMPRWHTGSPGLTVGMVAMPITNPLTGLLKTFCSPPKMP